MLKTLDDKGLLQECMQHYIDIQTSYDNENQERSGVPAGSAFLQANICSEFWSKGPISFKGAYFTQEHGTWGSYNAK